MIWCRLSLLVLGTIIMILANLAPGTIAIGSGDDKLNHALAFAVLAPVAACAFPRVNVIGLFFALMIFNAGIEISQAILDLGRQPDLADWAVGVLATLPVFGVIGLLRAARSRRDAHNG